MWISSGSALFAKTKSIARGRNRFFFEIITCDPSIQWTILTLLYVCFFCVDVDTLCPSQQFWVMSGGFPVFLGWTSTKQRIRCLAEGHNTMFILCTIAYWKFHWSEEGVMPTCWEGPVWIPIWTGPSLGSLWGPIRWRSVTYSNTENTCWKHRTSKFASTWDFGTSKNSHTDTSSKARCLNIGTIWIILSEQFKWKKSISNAY